MNLPDEVTDEALRRIVESSLGEPGRPATDWPIMWNGMHLGWSRSGYDIARRLAGELLTLRADLAQARADLGAAQDRLTWPRWMEAWDGSFGLVPADGGPYLAIVTPEDGMWRPWLGLGCRDQQSPGGFDEAEAYLAEHGRIRPGCTIRPAGVPR